MGGDSDLIFPIGESAGACLALQVTNTFIGKGQKSKVRGVVVLCPITAHPANIPERHKDIYNSYEDNATDVPLISKSVMETFIGAANLDSNSPKHFVTLSQNLKEFPPTFIITAEKDPLRDDGVLLERMLHEEGVKVKRKHYDGFGHVFWIFPMLKKRDVLLLDATEGIKFVLGAVEGNRVQ
jgi:versiconal hemiacetal acetate esterase